METILIGVSGLLVALLTFLFGMYRVAKTDAETRRTHVITQIDECIKKTTATNESIKRCHQRIDTIESSHEKLEGSVERMTDKLEIKLDKIMTFLLDDRSN